MPSVPPGVPPASASPPPSSGAPAALRHKAAQALRRVARDVAHDLTTPAKPPPLAHSARRWSRRLPYFFVFVLTAILLPVTGTGLTADYGLHPAVSVLLATAQVAPLLLAVNRPLQAWWIIFLADVVGGFTLLSVAPNEYRSWPWTPMVIIGYLPLSLFLGLRERRRTLATIWLLTGAAGTLFELISQDRSDGSPVLLFVLSGVLLLLGGTLRERHDVQRRLAEVETISEAERARRTLLEERARIARELHDVVAHHMSVITVQADSAPYRIEGLPPRASEEFGTIAATARESLTEMRRLLGVLRSDGGGDGAGDPERAPQPGLARVPQLVEATLRAGVPVEWDISDAVTRLGLLSPAVELSAYRIVQEALANVVRHAPGATTRVSLTTTGSHLGVLVINYAPAQVASAPLETTGTGHGLVGMRERVRLVGGTVDIGPLPDGGFRVAARLPLDPPESGHDSATGATANAPDASSGTPES
ncbi:sensor histidine kinase [Streptomyces zagrosensis]|uniref:histidine kinase n=1 Tax=Streptomyces zagrosensis TaxID=1042984 RepID=A0A7W9Q4B5_9ACTN|nr:sensor histidine kinase [Streptomyces zagrosensis]MBB5933171.1 signal transduction histidine kinase [Streptomyces zagrosensis]